MGHIAWINERKKIGNKMATKTTVTTMARPQRANLRTLPSGESREQTGVT